MRIAVLEWICGGGMHANAIDEIPSSLANEGRAMLACLLRLFSATQADVVTAIDERLFDRTQVLGPNCQLVEFPWMANLAEQGDSDLDAVNRTIGEWISIASKCDLTLVVAPEIDGILQRCLQALSTAGVSLLNCSSDFLNNASSKYRTAKALYHAGIPHPATFTLKELLDQPSTAMPDQIWCIKTDLGAGCDGLHVGRFDNIRQMASTLMTEDVSDNAFVIQPWIDGQAFSCSGIVDRAGKVIWFPLVTQSFDSVATTSDFSTRIYQGGQIVLNSNTVSRPTQLLDRTVKALAQPQDRGAFGWVGVDLLLDRSGQWIVIEVNPRMTTSIIGLSRAAPKNLGALMLAAYQGNSLPTLNEADWNAKISFNANGTLDTI